MNQQEIITKLKAHFPFKELEWRILNTIPDKSCGMVAAYVDNRAIQTRLDEAVGAYNWCNQFESWQDKAQICGISIYFDERKEWVTKFDGADNSEYEPIKGGLSDSMKRAAVQWGIGRYLYQLDNIWVEVEQKGKGYVIKQDQYPKLEAAYNKAVTAIFGVTTPDKTGTSASSDNKQPPVQPQPQQSTVTKEQPPVQQQQQSASNENKPATGMYTVQSLKPSGTSSQLVELLKDSGEVIKAYAKNDDALKVGACFTNLAIEEVNGKYGLYNKINAYELAA